MELYMQNLGLADKHTGRALSPPYGRQKGGAVGVNVEPLDKTRNNHQKNNTNA